MPIPALQSDEQAGGSHATGEIAEEQGQLRQPAEMGLEPRRGLKLDERGAPCAGARETHAETEQRTLPTNARAMKADRERSGTPIVSVQWAR